jgi:hypothetical protein
MARKVFFSFQYKADIMRAAQVRNSWVVTGLRESKPFVDAAEWETVMRKDDETIKRWIRDQMDGTSVTVVLVGASTYDSKWVKFEIEESYKKGKGIVAVRIHNVRHPQTGASAPGRNPLEHWQCQENGRTVQFSQKYKTYDYVADNGRENLAKWIEEAAKAAGR